MKLYNFPWGPYPRRLAIYLAEKAGIEIETIEVEFPHVPDRWPVGFLRSLNPAHSLPVLQLADGTRIRQSIAILEYLEELYPTPNMTGDRPEERAATREMIAVLDEAAAFFGLWARQGSQLNVDRHEASREAASVGAKRYAEKIRVVEAMMTTSMLCGDRVTTADCVGMALMEFTSDFYGVNIPTDCPKLKGWYNRFLERPRFVKPHYPPEMLSGAYGLCEQTKCFL